MSYAALRGYIDIVKICKEFGATNYNDSMIAAALKGHIDIVKLSKELGATDYNIAMMFAARYGIIETIKMCKEYNYTMMEAKLRGHIKLFALCRGWQGYDAMMSCSNTITSVNELLPVAMETLSVL